MLDGVDEIGRRSSLTVAGPVGIDLQNFPALQTPVPIRINDFAATLEFGTRGKLNSANTRQ